MEVDSIAQKKILEFCNGDNEAYTWLRKQYFPALKKFTGQTTHFTPKSMYEDGMQAAELHFIEIIKSYDPSRKVKFLTFLMTSLNNKRKYTYTYNNRDKRRSLFNEISTEKLGCRENLTGLPFFGGECGDHFINTDIGIGSIFHNIELEMSITNFNLTEITVFNLIKANLTLKEIGVSLNISYSRVKQISININKKLRTHRNILTLEV